MHKQNLNNMYLLYNILLKHTLREAIKQMSQKVGKVHKFLEPPPPTIQHKKSLA